MAKQTTTTILIRSWHKLNVSPLELFSRKTSLKLSAEYPDVHVVAVIEPDSLANLVTNLSVAKCANAQTTYLVCYLLFPAALCITSTISGMCNICHATTLCRRRYHVSRCWSCRLVGLAGEFVTGCSALHILILQCWVTLWRSRTCYQRCQL